MKITKTGKWTISQDEEYWTYGEEFDTKEEAIEIGKKEFRHEDFYVGQIYIVEFENGDLFDPSERIIDELCYCLEDEVGEYQEYWYENITKEQQEDLNKMINETVLNWIGKNRLQPNCFKIDDIELIIGDYEYEN